MIHVLTGQNDFARSQALKKLIAEFVAKYSEFGLEKVEAGDIEIGRLLENVASLPFLATRRMIVLFDPSSNKSLNEHIDTLIDAVSETTDLIIVERKFDKRSVLYKTLKKRCKLDEFNELDERTLPAWLVNEAKNRGGKLTLNDANYFVQRGGLNQLGTSNELDKMLAYEPHITRETIDMLIEPLPQSSIFDLLDAAFAGNHKHALELYNDQRKQQVELQAIMGMLAWQMHILAVVKANEKLGGDEIARMSKINPYIVRKTLNLVRNQTITDVKNLVKKVLDLDIRLKSEAIDADDALQHLLLSL